ncbi:MAG: hypothetical protein K5840_00130 [Eubacterium sp.]|nr:hypothetical protein [Eubacterium sp.]
MAPESFDDLIKGRYKDDYNKKVNAAIRKRFKGQDQLKERLDSMNPMLEVLATRYGMDATDLSKLDIGELVSKVSEDNTFYEDAALQAGMSVEAYKRMHKAEMENARIKQEQQLTSQQFEQRRKFEAFQQAAERVKQIYPGFDLDTEMANPEFERLTWQAGVPLQTAYEIMHKDEIITHGMQVATQKTKEMISNNIQSGKARPTENGVKSSGAAAKTEGTSPSTWSKEYRQQIKDRVRAGEKIKL